MAHSGSTLGLGLAMVALSAVSTGCTVCQYARLTAVEEPKLFNNKQDSEASMAAYRALADQAWAESGAACPEDCLAGDYAWGFREGFAEYVYAGGSGEPPAVPPRPYWQLDLRTAEGAAAVESWFAGYRHGARAARDGGYRRAATIRLSASLLDCDACGCPEDRRGAGSECSTCPVKGLSEPGPQLAEPTTLPPPSVAEPHEVIPHEVVEPIPPAPAPEATPVGQPPVIDAAKIKPPAFEASEAAAIERAGAPAQQALFQIVR